LTSEQLGWICTEQGSSDAKVQFAGAEVASAAWHRSCGKGRGLLKLRFKGDGGISRFAGFKQEDLGALKAHMKKHFKVQLEEQPVATEGWSWGDWRLSAEDDFQIMINNKLGAEVPLSDLSQVTVMGKTDLNIELMEDDTAKPGDDILNEVRFYIPGVSLPTAGGLSEQPAERLRDEIQKLAGVSATGEVIAHVPDLPVVAPRGRHDFEFCDNSVKIHGKTQTYTTKYRNISRLFLLTMPNDNQLVFVMGLEQPLRQGQQLHQFLVLTLDKERMISVKNIPKERLQAMSMSPTEDQPVYSLVAKLFKELSGKAVIAAASEFKELQGTNGSFCVRCSYKAQPGFLFPLKKSMLFVTKPVVWIRYDNVDNIEFGVAQMRRNSFDLAIHTTSKTTIEFSQVDRQVYEAVLTFFQRMGVKIANFKEVSSQIAAPATRTRGNKTGKLEQDLAPEDEEDDEDYEDEEADADESDDDNEDDSEPEEEEKKPPAKRARRGK